MDSLWILYSLDVYSLSTGMHGRRGKMHPCVISFATSGELRKITSVQVLNSRQIRASAAAKAGRRVIPSILTPGTKGDSSTVARYCPLDLYIVICAPYVGLP